jgi:2-dehydropantoate 2-reductase
LNSYSAPRKLLVGTAIHPSVRILVFGAGAIGSLIGGLLSSRHDVTLVARGDHVDAIRRCNLRITGMTELCARPWAMTEVPAARQDLVIISTKAYGTAMAVASLKRFWHTSLFLTLQNGLRNADVIARKADRVAAGTTSHGVTYIREGLVRHAGLGDTRIGAFQEVTKGEVKEICREFTACGIPATCSEDIRRDLWAKVIVNAAINPLTAIARIENGRLLKTPELRTLLRQSCEEAAAVARAEGHDISPSEATRAAEKVARRTAKNRSSMLQDLERGRRTEVSEISGSIVEAGRWHGISLPAVDTIRLSVSELARRG